MPFPLLDDLSVHDRGAKIEKALRSLARKNVHRINGCIRHTSFQKTSQFFQVGFHFGRRPIGDFLVIPNPRKAIAADDDDDLVDDGKFHEVPTPDEFLNVRESAAAYSHVGSVSALHNDPTDMAAPCS